MNEPERIIFDSVDNVLAELEVVAHSPVQGMGMHKVIGESVLRSLDDHGYTIVPKGADSEQ